MSYEAMTKFRFYLASGDTLTARCAHGIDATEENALGMLLTDLNELKFIRVVAGTMGTDTLLRVDAIESVKIEEASAWIGERSF